MRTFAFALLAFFALPFGCGGDDSGSSTTPADSSTDTRKDDTSTTDSTVDSVIDSGTDTPADSATDSPPDATKDVAKDTSGAGCTLDTDCRTFSSYCDGTELKPCTCLGLGKSAPDPKCDGSTVTCFVDPCMSKSAWCNAGVCDVK